MKEKYIELAKEKFVGKALDLVLEQIELFYNKDEVLLNKYEIGEDVKLKKGTFLHGIFGEIETLNYVVENGFISVDFTDGSRINKISNSVGMWNIKEDMTLREYIELYSGFTVSYSIGRGPDSKGTVTELIPYHKFDEYTERINNDESVWMYWGDQTKEVRFMPSLVSEKKQIGFILNMGSEYAKKMAKNDVWNTELDEKTLEPFLDYRYYPKFLNERFNRNALTTDRESAIIFGLPSKLIEGILVGRKIENDKEKLNIIKSKLPNCYICNLDGKVIVGNK